MKTVTLGMFAVGIVILAVRVAHFYFKSRSRDWTRIAPFGMGAIAFAAAGACAGGLIGTVLTWARNGVGKVGDFALEKGTGAQHVQISRPAEFGVLTPFGAVVMLVMIGVFIVALKSMKKRPKKEVLWGAPCGLAMGPFLGAITVTPLINWIGHVAIQSVFFS
ncbi:hypothetical protein [Streptomyces misionensis]|uniref:hypothetical protein n=1 Tax=Streptomyces misionensis TaxID=67331 RepID=UPI003683C887